MTIFFFGPFAASRSSVLGSGHFGTVLAGVHRKTGERVAIKIEPQDSPRTVPSPKLAREAEVYRALDGASARVPRMRWFGRAHGHFALVLDRLGPSIRNVHRDVGLELDASAVRHVGCETLLGLEALHDAGWLHCDVKPANLLLPAEHGDCNLGTALATAPLLALVDFGLSRRWGDDDATSVERRRVVGTGRFASLSNHLGESPLGPRDDVEATLLSMIWLRRGRLPWSGLTAPTKRERFAQMLARKQAASVDELSEGMPPGFEAALRSSRQLAFNSRPDYGELRRLLQTA